jgi:hypothetical protein
MPERRRVCGLDRKKFLLISLVIIVIIIAAVVGGVVCSNRARSHDDSPTGHNDSAASWNGTDDHRS